MDLVYSPIDGPMIHSTRLRSESGQSGMRRPNGSLHAWQPPGFRPWPGPNGLKNLGPIEWRYYVASGISLPLPDPPVLIKSQ